MVGDFFSNMVMVSIMGSKSPQGMCWTLTKPIVSYLSYFFTIDHQKSTKMAFFRLFWHFSSIFNIIQPKIPFFRHFLLIFVFANVSRCFQIFVVYNRFHGRVNVFCYFQLTYEAYYFKRALRYDFLFFFNKFKTESSFREIHP